MLSMKSPLNEMDIADVEVLRPGTVYKVTGHANEVIVLKSDVGNVTGQQFVHQRRVMKAVDRSGGNAKPLTDTEKGQLRNWVDFMKRVTQDFSANLIPNFQSAPAAKDLDDNLRENPHALWTKMPFADLTPIEKALAARMGEGGNKDKSGVHAFAEGLKGPGGIEQLGRIIAADLFINNPDRFNPFEASKKQYGGKEFKFKALKNIGNVFLLGKNTNQNMTVSGHDFFEPSNGYRNVDMSVREVQESYDEAWMGAVLCDRKQRKTFVKNVIADLEMILCPTRHRLSRRTKLGSRSADRLDAGIRDGMQLIVQQMGQKYPQNAPPGIQERTDAYRAALA